jgi:hypothetical protein
MPFAHDAQLAEKLDRFANTVVALSVLDEDFNPAIRNQFTRERSWSPYNLSPFSIPGPAKSYPCGFLPAHDAQLLADRIANDFIISSQDSNGRGWEGFLIPQRFQSATPLHFLLFFDSHRTCSISTMAHVAVLITSSKSPTKKSDVFAMHTLLMACAREQS